MAECLEVPKAEALVAQARLWPNPTLEIEEVNLWATQRQLSVFGEELQGFGGGDFGRNQQFGASIEQLILTAGKRKKLVAVEQVAADQAKEYLEDLLRNLKVEFRNNLTELQFLQFSKVVYEEQLNAIRNLARAFERQVELGNIPKGEYIRLRALELEFFRTINEINKEINAVQMELRLLMRLPAQTRVVLTDEGYQKDLERLRLLSLPALLDTSEVIRPDLKIARLDQKYFSHLHAYQRAQRTPNLTFKGAYDRGGNFMYNFVGFGVALDLPVFDRNQGNIQYAQIGMEQSRLRYEQTALHVENDIALAFENLSASVQFFESIEPGYEATLDELLRSYTKNFTERNISLIEFIDFLESYLENKNIILEAGKEVNQKAEELNFAVGIDVIKN